jgi:pimeloyl-ACP methyl ester carboxylesterase
MSYPVVLLSGTLCNGKVWEEVCRSITTQEKLMTLTIGQHSDWQQELAAIVEVLPEKFIVAGFSLGGIVALALLTHYPERIAELILVASTARSDPPESRQQRQRILANAKTIEDFTQLGRNQISDVDRDNLGEKKVECIIEMAKSFTLEQFTHQTALACTRQETLSSLANADIPVRLIYGTNDNACGVDKQQDIINVCPTAKAYPVSGGGHWLPLSHPNEVASVIQEALVNL